MGYFWEVLLFAGIFIVAIVRAKQIEEEEGRDG